MTRAKGSHVFARNALTASWQVVGERLSRQVAKQEAGPVGGYGRQWQQKLPSNSNQAHIVGGPPNKR